MMASACVTNTGVSPETFLDYPPACPTYGWLSPRISFSCDLAGDGPKRSTENPEAGSYPAGPSGEWRDKPDPDASAKDLIDFEFLLEDPAMMLTADELFSGGKLVTLQKAAAARPAAEPANEIPSPEPLDSLGAGSLLDPSAPSPKAPRCSSRWRELLGLKRQQQQQGAKMEHQKAAASAPLKNPNPKSLKHFLHRNPKSSSTDPSLSLPLLRDGDCDSIFVSSHVFLPSSGVGPGHEDLPRLSLDSEKPIQVPISHGRMPPRVRVTRTGSAAARSGRSTARRTAPAPRAASVDSPRMNSSGRVVFQGLERSSSSPGSIYGGLRVRHRGVERPYPAGVRITPVLNVPVSVFGLGQLFAPQKKERDGTSSRHGGGGGAGAGNNGSIRAKIERERA